MELEHLPPDEVQASIDQALRFSLEVTTLAKVLRARHDELPDFGPEMGVALLKAIRTMNAAVTLGYHPTDSIYGEVEKNMQDDTWRGGWIERMRAESYQWA